MLHNCFYDGPWRPLVLNCRISTKWIGTSTGTLKSMWRTTWVSHVTSECKSCDQLWQVSFVVSTNVKSCLKCNDLWPEVECSDTYFFLLLSLFGDAIVLFYCVILPYITVPIIYNFQFVVTPFCIHIMYSFFYVPRVETPLYFSVVPFCNHLLKLLLCGDPKLFWEIFPCTRCCN